MARERVHGAVEAHQVGIQVARGPPAGPAEPRRIDVIGPLLERTDAHAGAPGQQLQQVAAGFEATGKYSVVETGSGKGVYTFAGADAGRELLFFYAYTDTGDGETMLVTNQLQGYGPVFELYLMMPYQGANGLHLFNCRSSKMSAPRDRKSTRLNSSHLGISYAVFC